MKTKRAYLITEDGQVERLEVLEGHELSFKHMHPLIGCTMIEHVSLDGNADKVDMWVDEEFLMKDIPILNPLATKLYRAAYPHIDPNELAICGNAIVTDNSKSQDFLRKYINVDNGIVL